MSMLGSSSPGLVHRLPGGDPCTEGGNMIVVFDHWVDRRADTDASIRSANEGGSRA
jgi:hypothetical protein